jgi:hypothetical protein
MIQIWAVHIPAGPVAECQDWGVGEEIARSLSRADGGTYRVISTTSPARAEFGNGQRLPGPYTF